MAINFTVSYTFTAGTTISSSQVNTNFSDEANVWTGLEGLTKTFAKLKLDIDPATALEVATKQYVDHYSTWRRPVLQYSSGTVVNIETGINGTSGQAQILFPDGSIRTDSTTGRINCNLAQVAALSGSWQSGVRTGTVTANNWYSFYAVKTTDDTAKFVTVADTVIPTQANYATLNSNFGTSSWVYLGTLPYGDNSAATTAIPKFVHVGNRIVFYNISSTNMQGVRLTNTAGATSLTWTYASGTTLSSAQVPGHLVSGIYSIKQGTNGVSASVQDSAAGFSFISATWGSGNHTFFTPEEYLAMGAKVTPSSSMAIDINLTVYTDGVLGVGANPIL